MHDGTTTEPVEVLARFLDAVTAGDLATVEAIYHPDALVWHSNDGLEQPASANLLTLRWMAANLPGFRYENVRRYAIEGGAVEQHDTVVPLPDRDPLVLPACLVVRVDGDGRITRLDEYIDGKGVDELVAAVTGSRRGA
jgi:ketosteroid isomerase-like protein